MASDEVYTPGKRVDETAAGAEVDVDEEAQLLPGEDLNIEEFDFEDNIEGHTVLKKRRLGVLAWLSGPQPPQIQTIQPFFPTIQERLPDVLNSRIPKWTHQLILLALFLILWGLIFVGFLIFQLPIKDGAGGYVVNLDCVDTLWRRKNECGIGGIDCRPFANTTFAFRCPAKCESVQILNPRAVGPLDVNYRPLVIGDEVYRGDSFMCGSAIHAGIISGSKGGCGRITLVGERDEYPAAERNGIKSIPFDSYFPLSFSLSLDKSFRCSSDPRQGLLLVSLFFTSLLSLFTTSPKMFFPIFTMVFAHVSFASDPPSASYRNITVIPDHISMFAKRLFPALFCAIIIYTTTVKRTLSDLTAHVEKTVLWLGGFFFGALSNYTFDWIPISRLTAHDLEQQPGAKVALAFIIIILVAIIAGQAYFFWLEGRLPRYLALYGLFIFGILVFLAIPGVSLRIHHYILALLLLPGTSLQTRSSLLYQGILLGLFVNGIARWDFDSILQTTDALRADGKFDAAIPKMLEPVISLTGEGLFARFSWTTPPPDMDGISVLVNDVERDRAFFNDGVDGDVTGFEWERPIGMQMNEYLRFAYVRNGRALDYTKAGTLSGNGTWTMQQEE